MAESQPSSELQHAITVPHFLSVRTHMQIWVWPKKQPSPSLQDIRGARVQAQSAAERVMQTIRNLLP